MTVCGKARSTVNEWLYESLPHWLFRCRAQAVAIFERVACSGWNFWETLVSKALMFGHCRWALAVAAAAGDNLVLCVGGVREGRCCRGAGGCPTLLRSGRLDAVDAASKVTDGCWVAGLGC